MKVEQPLEIRRGSTEEISINTRYAFARPHGLRKNAEIPFVEKVEKGKPVCREEEEEDVLTCPCG